MIILIYGSSHTGKTNVSQQLLEKLSYPYLSIDHLKMGLIRSKNTKLTVTDDYKLTEYLWPIVVEIIKTAIENKQNLIVEGDYIPHNFKNSFSKAYLDKIKTVCLIFSEAYIQNNYRIIEAKRNIIEQRIGDDFINKDDLLKENKYNLEQSIKYGNNYYLIDGDYEIDLEELYD